MPTAFSPRFIVAPETYAVFKSPAHFQDSFATVTDGDDQIVIVKKNSTSALPPHHDWKLCFFEQIERAREKQLLRLFHHRLEPSRELICLEISARHHLFICLPALDSVRQLIAGTNCHFVLS